MHRIILVGINDTAPSIAAARWALERARSTLDSVVLLHVLSDADAAHPSREDHARVFLSDQAVLLQRAAPEINISTELLTGGPLEQLTDAAENGTLLVIGTHKTGFVQGRVFGSKYIRLAATTPIPMAVIPATAHRDHRAGIVVGIKDSPSAEAAIGFAVAEARRTLSSLTLIHYWSLPNVPGENAGDHDRRELQNSLCAGRLLADAKSLAETLAPDVAVRTRSVCRPTAEGLLDAASSAALLVLGRTTAAGSVGGAVLGSTVHDVLLNLSTATIVVPPTRRHTDLGAFRHADAEQVAIP